MVHDFDGYALSIDAKVRAHFSKDNHLSMRQRIFSQNENYGYSTVPEEEWFSGNQQVVVAVHDRSMRRPPTSLPHNHTFFEMSYVYKGQFFNTIESTEYTQNANSLVLLSPQTKHFCYIKEPSTTVFNFLISSTLIQDIFLQMFSHDTEVFRFFLDSLYNTKSDRPFLTFQCDQHLLTIIGDIIQEYIEAPPFYQNIITAKFIELFSKLSRIHHQSQQEKVLSISGHLHHQIYAYMKNNYAHATIAGIAEEFNYSTSFISKLLKDKFGKKFSELLSDIRLDNACRYLSHSDIAVEHIVEIVGYRDVSHFYKIFKSKYGMAPNQYRSKNSPLHLGKSTQV